MTKVMETPASNSHYGTIFIERGKSLREILLLARNGTRSPSALDAAKLKT
jgi:hypothetical protein